MKAHGELLFQATSVENQRKQFSYLSEALIASLQAFAYSDTLYVQHCPMAFDNQGANWLSTEKQVLNPYFGDVMLRCGRVEEMLHPQSISNESSK